MNRSAELARRRFLSLVGKGLGLATLSSTAIASLLSEIQAATRCCFITGLAASGRKRD